MAHEMRETVQAAMVVLVAVLAQQARAALPSQAKVTTAAATTHQIRAAVAAVLVRLDKQHRTAQQVAQVATAQQTPMTV